MSEIDHRVPNATSEQVDAHVRYAGNIVRIDRTRRACGDGRQPDFFKDQNGAIFTFGADGGILQARLAILHRVDDNVNRLKITEIVDEVIQTYRDHNLFFNIHTDTDTEDGVAVEEGVYKFMTATKQNEDWIGCGHHKNAGNRAKATAYGLDPSTMRIAYEYMGQIHPDVLRVKVLQGNHQESVVIESKGKELVPVPYNPHTLQAFIITPRVTQEFVEGLDIPGVRSSDMLTMMNDHQEVTAEILAQGRQIYHFYADSALAFLPIPGAIIG